VRKSIAKSALPEPDAIIGGVGTQIELRDAAGQLEGWPRHDNWDAEIIRGVLGNERRLRLQPEQFLSPFKVSFFADQATSEDLAAWQLKLQNAGMETRMVYSSQRDLDFLPCGCDKGTATAFLAAQWDIPTERVIACGDTGNDSAMFAQGFCGVVVGNALEELKMLDAPRIYLAQAGFAAGVLEGVQHWMSVSDSNMAELSIKSA
jgi:mannosylfructose-6-phosphate phosphatase